MSNHKDKTRNTARRGNSSLSSSPSSSSWESDVEEEHGVSILEYLIALIFLGVIIIGALDFLQPASQGFYSEMSEGAYAPYPINYISPP